MPQALRELLTLLKSDFKDWELSRLLLTALNSEAPVSMNVLCDIARKHLPCQVDFDVKPLVRQAVSLLRAAAALHFAQGKNPGYVPMWSDDGETLAWKSDTRYLLELARHAGLTLSP
jgi:hypothetical protein